MKKALLIGLNYTDTESELPDCEKDANDVEKFISDDYDVIKLNKVSAKDLFNLIVQIRANLTPADTFLFYYSGHGTQIESKTEKDGIQEALVLWTGGNNFELFKDKELKGLLNTLNCTVIQCFDSCFAAGMGSIVADKNEDFQTKAIPYFGKSVYKIPVAIKAKARKLPIVKLFACSEKETAQSTGNGGLFTLSLLKVLKRQVSEVGRVIKAVEFECNGVQTPSLSVKNTTSLFKIF